ncbi:MAG TPA: sulfatase [Chitinophagales bacterium]|nr:sulfatase [Chitinophagales bacterium]
MINKKRLGLIGAVVLVVVSCSAFLFKTTETDKFKIYFDEKLIEGKTAYLKQPVSDYKQHNRPNVIVILADDLGQTDISLYGSKLISTPNIDAIGKDGATFTEGYISSPVCSPSRAGLLTGRYQQRFGHEFQPNHRYLKNMAEYYGFKMLPRFKPLTPIKSHEAPPTEERLRQGLPPSEITLAELLKKYDYATAITGKWHLGAADFAIPTNRGFDYQYGFYEAFTLYAPKNDPNIVNAPVRGDFMDQHEWKASEGRPGNCAILRNCCEHQEEKKYLTDKLTDEAIAFIDRTPAEKPFFLYLPYNAPHAPLQATKAYYAQFAHIKDPVKRVYAAMIKNMDDQVGRLMHHLDSMGIADNTIVVFLSDNGGTLSNGTTTNAPFKGGKFTNFEGGLRVPFMMKWKNHIPAGTVYTNPVISLDIFATVAGIVGIDLPTDRTYDGVNLVPHLTGDIKQPAHDKLFWRSEFNKAIRKGDYKLIVNEHDNVNLLFNIKEDKEERHNLFVSNPAKAKELLKDIEDWETDLVKPLWPRVVNYVYKDDDGKYIYAF